MTLRPQSLRFLSINGKEYPVVDDDSNTAQAQICIVLPSLNDKESQARREELLALQPVHAEGPNGELRGWYVPVSKLDAKL